MNFGEIKKRVMFQTNNDADDLGDFLPHLNDYINDGYDRLVVAYAGKHVSSDSVDYTPLTNDKASPALPDWTHSAIADWATWLIYRNGNIQKQNRGYQYRSTFEAIEAQLLSMTAESKGLSDTKSRKQYFFNIPR